RHPEDGAAIIGKLGRLRAAVPLVRHHHERWDGRGYPDGLAGEAVPLEAYVVGLADAWDAMTTDRPYQLALSWDEAAEEVRRGRGRDGRARGNGDDHRGCELVRRADTARGRRGRPPARAGGAARAPGARPARAPAADHEVGGVVHRRGANPGARGHGLSRGAGA